MIHHISSPLFDSKHGVDIFVFGDLQQTPKKEDKQKKGHGGFVREAWEQFRNEWRASKNPYGLGLGDYGDWLRPSLRPLINGALGKDDSAREMLDTMVLKSHDEIIDSMQFMDKRLIGLHEGHHVHYLASGGNTDQRLASALHAPFLGFSASTRLVLEDKTKSFSGRIVTLISMHGNASGRKVSTALAWLGDNFANAWIADIFAMGHGCKSGNMAPFERQAVRRDGPAGIIRSIPRLMVVGGFSRGYTDGWKSDYVERAGMTPQPLGWGIIRLTPKWSVSPDARGLARNPIHRSGKMSIDVDVANRFYTEDDA